MDKAPDAYRTISEVGEDLDIAQHVLRFWETRFPQIKPLKRGGGRRYYRPDDVELLKGIRHLLYREGYTIKGVQRILREQGPRSVMAVGRFESLSALGEAPVLPVQEAPRREPPGFRADPAPTPMPSPRAELSSISAHAEALYEPAFAAPDPEDTEPPTVSQPAAGPAQEDYSPVTGEAAAIPVFVPSPAKGPASQVSMFRGGLPRGEAAGASLPVEVKAQPASGETRSRLRLALSELELCRSLISDTLARHR